MKGFPALFLLALASMSVSPARAAEPVLKGRLVVEWSSSEQFIYRRDPKNPLLLKTSKGVLIDPKDIYTDGGSIPQIFQNISGLSPWNLGPAYIIHDWLFIRKGCKAMLDPKGPDFTFEESAQILGEAARELLKKHFIDPNSEKIMLIESAVNTFVARRAWDNAKFTCASRIPKRNPVLFDTRGQIPGRDPGPSPTRSIGPGSARIVVDVTFD